MRRASAGLICAVFAVLGSSVPASAQDPLRMGVGFTLTQTSETGAGGAVTFTKPFTQVSIAKLGWVADFSGTGFADFQTVITAGGVRATLPPCGNWTFFGQFQFGALMEHDSFSGWSTEWGYAPGIGLVLARPNWKWDVLFQADLGWVENSLAGPRFLVGIEKRFGK